MNRDIIYTFFGTIIGSAIEEGIEEIFPGVGELGLTGEISGAIAGLLGSQLTKDEVRESVHRFVKYAYKATNNKELNEELADSELNLFSEKFNKLPKKEKQRILNSFKSIAPYDYEFMVDFLNGMEGA